jgi:hypothetical protein
MPGPIVTERELRQTLTATMAQRSPAIQDLVYNSTPLMAVLREKSRVKTASGPEIRVPLMIDKLGAQWFTGYDKLRVEPKELINSAVFTWKRVVSMFSLTGTELMFNEGRGQVLDLMATYLEAAETAVAEEYEIALHGDGTGQGGRSIIGMGGALPILANAGTYGGIDRAAQPIYRTTTYDATTDFTDIGTTWDSTTARPMIERIAAQRSKGQRYPKLWICDILSYQAISASLTAQQRITTRVGANSGTAFAGFEALSIWTPAGAVDIVCATGVGNVMPANTIYALDPEGLAIYEFPSKKFTPFHPGEGMRPINQDAIAQGIEWAGEFVVENPRHQVRVVTA